MYERNMEDLFKLQMFSRDVSLGSRSIIYTNPNTSFIFSPKKKKNLKLNSSYSIQIITIKKKAKKPETSTPEAAALSVGPPL